MQLWHMNGAGNDFMVMDARGKTFDFSALAKKLCALSGADGFMAVDDAFDADFRLHFYNSDGTRGEMCGNGSRCICRFAYEHGIAGSYMTMHTDAGIVEGWRMDESMYRVKLNNPGVLDLHRTDTAAYVELGNPGVPHAVAEYPGLTHEMKEVIRPAALKLRHDRAFPKGVNVNFYTLLDERTVRVLTFERGVEDYTLACGTGCASVAVTLWAKGVLPSGKLTALNPGGILNIQVEGREGTVTAVYLEGPTEITEILEIPL